MTRSLVRFRLPASATGQGGSRLPGRDDSLSSAEVSRPSKANFRVLKM